jgi:hypothetical protein
MVQSEGFLKLHLTRFFGRRVGAVGAALHRLASVAPYSVAQ